MEGEEGIGRINWCPRIKKKARPLLLSRRTIKRNPSSAYKENLLENSMHRRGEEIGFFKKKAIEDTL